MMVPVFIFLWLTPFMASQKFYPVLGEKNFTLRPIPGKEPDIKFAFAVEDCKHQGNSTPVAMPELLMVNDNGLIIWWNRAMGAYDNVDLNDLKTVYQATDDLQGIFDCTITVKLGPHDPRIGYQEFIFGLIKFVDFKTSAAMDNVTKAIKQLDPDNRIANKGYKELLAECAAAESDCILGCIIIEYGNKVIRTCTRKTENMGDKFNWYTRDNIRIRIMLVGAFVGKDLDGNNVIIAYPPITAHLRLEFTRMFGGPCYSVKDQYYCPTFGVCIDYALACDNIGMDNCPRTPSNKYDEPYSCTSFTNSLPSVLNIPDPNALNNLIIFWVLLGIFMALLAYLLLNYCFWRPGYFIWRCGRLRNWCNFGNCCFKLCHDCSKSSTFSCCKTQGTYDTTEVSTVNWSKFPTGDGFHMRENR